MAVAASGVIIPQAPGQNTSRFGILDPLVHAFRIAQSSQPLQQANKAFALAPVALTKGIAQVLASGLGAVVGNGGFAVRQTSGDATGTWQTGAARWQRIGHLCLKCPIGLKPLCHRR